MTEPKEISTRISPSRITYNLEFEDVIKENSLLDFNRVMSITETRTVKHEISQRRIGIFTLKNRDKILSAFIKRHFPLSFGKYFKERIRLASSKTAFDEFDNIISFHKAGLPTMVPVAAGKRPCRVTGSESFLITKEIKGCVTLENFVESSFKDKTFTEKKELIKKTALLTKKMHDSGFNHRDYYLCHLLIGIEEHNKDELFIVDLHRVDRRKIVPERWKIKDLAALNYSAESEHITKTDKLRFLKFYLSIGKLSILDKLFALKIIGKTNKILKRSRCCLRKNKYFAPIKKNNLKGYAALPVDSDVLKQMENLDTLFSNSGSLILKDSVSASCLLFSSLPDLSGFYLKKYHVKNIFDAVKNTLRSSKAKRSWTAANTLKTRGIPTPEPILFLERKSSLFTCESYFVTEALVHAKPLNLYMDVDFKLLSGQDKRAFIKELAMQVKKMHDSGIWHRDLKSTNILVEGDDCQKFWFTDLDAINVSDALLLTERSKDLARLNCSFLDTAILSKQDRLFFLKVYLDRANRKELKKYWDAVVLFTGLKLKKSKREFR